MIATGIVRKTDSTGRLILPIELRRILDIEYKDGLEIFTEGDRIILRKYQPVCVFCGNNQEVDQYKGKYVCKQCSDMLNQQGEKTAS